MTTQTSIWDILHEAAARCTALTLVRHYISTVEVDKTGNSPKLHALIEFLKASQHEQAADTLDRFPHSPSVEDHQRDPVVMDLLDTLMRHGVAPHQLTPLYKIADENARSTGRTTLQLEYTQQLAIKYPNSKVFFVCHSHQHIKSTQNSFKYLTRDHGAASAFKFEFTTFADLPRRACSFSDVLTVYDHNTWKF
jgi:hypothetical protein